MPTIIKNIALIEAGGESLVSAKRANEIIERLNAITSAILAPNVNVGNFQMTGSQFILDLSQFDARLKSVESRLDGANITANGSCSGNNITINISLNI